MGAGGKRKNIRNESGTVEVVQAGAEVGVGSVLVDHFKLSVSCFKLKIRLTGKVKRRDKRREKENEKSTERGEQTVGVARAVEVVVPGRDSHTSSIVDDASVACDGVSIRS